MTTKAMPVMMKKIMSEDDPLLTDLSKIKNSLESRLE